MGFFTHQKFDEGFQGCPDRQRHSSSGLLYTLSARRGYENTEMILPCIRYVRRFSMGFEVLARRPQVGVRIAQCEG